MISQTFTPLEETLLPSQATLKAAFVDKSLSTLRTPAAVIDRTKFRQNCEHMAAKNQALGIKFRAHVKTHKTAEGLRYQLEVPGGVRAIICSTLMECRQVLKSGLVAEGLVQDVCTSFRVCDGRRLTFSIQMLYGLPCGIDKIQELNSISVEMGEFAFLRLMIDSPGQIVALEKFNAEAGRQSPWSIFIKVDGGGRYVFYRLKRVHLFLLTLFVFGRVPDEQAYHRLRVT